MSVNISYAGKLKRFLPFKNISYQGISQQQVRSPVVAIIDTGIDLKEEVVKKSLITAKVSTNGNLKINNEVSRKSFGLDFTTGDLSFSPTDNHGHGTHIAGIINEINPHAKILAIKYYNPMSSDEENLKSTVKAIQAAVELNVDIINYSSGGEGFSQQEYKALENARNKGIIIITAAGNFGKNIDNISSAYYPASYNLNNIISVINIDKYGILHPTSNWGVKSADIATYGTDVTSYLPNNSLGTLSGTSQSTAIISGYTSLLVGSSIKKTNFIKLKNTILKSVKKSISLTDKCKTGGFFDPVRFKNIIKRKFRKIANK